MIAEELESEKNALESFTRFAELELVEPDFRTDKLAEVPCSHKELAAYLAMHKMVLQDENGRFTTAVLQPNDLATAVKVLSREFASVACVRERNTYTELCVDFAYADIARKLK